MYYVKVPFELEIISTLEILTHSHMYLSAKWKGLWSFWFIEA